MEHTDFLITIYSGAYTVFIDWLMFILLHSKLKHKPRFAGKVVSKLLTAAFLLGILLLDYVTDYIAGFQGAPVFLLILFLYAVVVLEGTLKKKIFWVLISFLIVSASMLLAALFLVVANPTTVSSNVSASEMSWITIQGELIAVILQGLATFILINRSQATRASRPVEILLVLISILSIIALMSLHYYGTSDPTDPVTVPLKMYIAACIVGINFITFALYNYMGRLNARALEHQVELQRAELEKVRYEEIQVLYEATRNWRHDFRNHIQTIQGLFSQEKHDDLNSYLATLSQSSGNIEFKVNSGNDLIDAILNAKIARAEENGIRLETDIRIPDIGTIDPLDLTALIGNLFDNALEACERMERREEAYISFSAWQAKKTQLMIALENSSDSPPKTQDGRFLTSKKQGDHGIGLSQIDATVAKYGGVVIREAKENAFTTLVRMPLGEN